MMAGLTCPANDVPHKPFNGQRKASPPRLTPYETFSVALEKQLEGTRITGKGDPHSQVNPPPPPPPI